jgi:hypothetical protein
VIQMRKMNMKPVRIDGGPHDGLIATCKDLWRLCKITHKYIKAVAVDDGDVRAFSWAKYEKLKKESAARQGVLKHPDRQFVIVARKPHTSPLNAFTSLRMVRG